MRGSAIFLRWRGGRGVRREGPTARRAAVLRLGLQTKSHPDNPPLSRRTRSREGPQKKNQAFLEHDCFLSKRFRRVVVGRSSQYGLHSPWQEHDVDRDLGIAHPSPFFVITPLAGESVISCSYAFKRTFSNLELVLDCSVSLSFCDRFPTTRAGRRRRGAALHAQRAAGRRERPWPAQKSLPSRAS